LFQQRFKPQKRQAGADAAQIRSLSYSFLPPWQPRRIASAGRFSRSVSLSREKFNAKENHVH
jgi:hypothetical protein